MDTVHLANAKVIERERMSPKLAKLPNMNDSTSVIFRVLPFSHGYAANRNLDI